MEKPPCAKECPGRSTVCHANCKAYAEYAARRETEREERAKEAQYKRDFDSVRYERVKTIAINSLPIERRKRT